MIGVNHTLSGALIGALVPAQYTVWVPVIAFVSHFVLDMFPHYGRDDAAPVHSQRFRRILYLDAVLCFAVLFLACWLYPDRILYIVAGTFFATLPDFLWIFHYYVKIKGVISDAFFKFSAKIQWGERPWAWSLDVLYAMIMLGALVGLS